MAHSNGIQKRAGRVLPPLPVDRGWAWLIMLAAYVNLMLAVSFGRSLSLLLPYILDRYQEPATVTTLAFGIGDLSWSVTNIAIPTVLLPRFSVRSLALVGAAFHSLSILALAYSPNIIVFNCIFGFLGSSGGLMIVPSLIHLGHFFKKRLSFSNAFTHTGGSVATVYSPLLTQLLLDKFGFQGTLLILAGITLNCVAASMLLRPLSMYDHVENLTNGNGHIPGKHELKDFDSFQMETRELTIFDDDEKEANELSKFLEKKQDKIKNITNNSLPRDLKMTERGQLTKNTQHEITEGADETEKLIPRIESELTQSKSKSVDDLNKIILLLPATTSDITSSHQTPVDVLNERNSISSITNNTFPDQDVSSKQTNLNNIYSTTNDCLLLGSNIHLKELAFDFDLEMSPESQKINHSDNQTDPIVDMEPNLSENYASVPPVSCWSIGKIRERLRSSVLLNPVAVMLILAGGLSTPGGNMYMPVLGLENGLTSEQVPWMLTISGFADIVGKLAIGYFADLGYLRTIHIACLAQITMGLMCQFTMFYKGFGAMAAMATVFGLTGGLCQALITPMIIEMVGLQHLGQVTPIYFLGSGVSTLILNISFGAIRDATGSFIGGFNFVGGMFLLSLTILLLEPAFVRCRDKRSSKNFGK